MLREIHRYIWLSNWFMGRGLKKRTDRQTDRHCVDFNIDDCQCPSDQSNLKHCRYHLLLTFNNGLVLIGSNPSPSQNLILPSNQSSALLLWQLLCHQMQSSYSSSKFVAFFFHQGDSFYSSRSCSWRVRVRIFPKLSIPSTINTQFCPFAACWAVWAVRAERKLYVVVL